MAKDSHSESRAHRIGQYVGQVWRNWVGEEQRFVAWLIKRNVPAGIARVVPWCFRLFVLGLLLYYVGFWLAVLLVIPQVVNALIRMILMTKIEMVRY
ncbi:DUF3742 family protein [Brenneria tiliae]|uniref:DUF3742 family protein n=1 Tax=Brenneria tiliae TaxID=2914984 RepID=UPI002014B8FB|nr:DUF3742 family protein [Brenneria tiliae]MCL2896139.1 DUF3742 family protein [Brenneria tiliae]MCL2900666.1 DUF3742 family protein [Brenneria tiliae]